MALDSHPHREVARRFARRRRRAVGGTVIDQHDFPSQVMVMPRLT
jgi:hypothetical protein